MKKKIYFLSVIFSLFALSGILTSCENLNWFANFMDDLNALKVPFTFYSAAGGTGTSFEKSYIIGKTISGEQLVNDSKDFILKKGADGSTPYRSHAVVHGLKKSSVSSGDDGVETDINGFVTSVEVKEAVSFIPVIWYNAEITCMYEALEDPGDYSIKGEKFFFAGEAESRIVERIPEEIQNKYKLPGFNYYGLSDSNSQFSSTQITSASMKYARKYITLTFNANGGNFSGSAVTNTVSGPYESEILNASSGSYKAPERSGYTFVKWDPPVPETFPADDATFTAVWSVTPQDITYMTVNACNSENHFFNLIRNILSLPSQYTPGEKTIIPNPEIFLWHPDENDMLFDGWYYNETGDTLVKL
ncbi:MAG: InlB B-repeat-containing protein, partial [Treponema sp.]|nr:InlB B-repeat-containing protein [Candidatus Treponema scatequi]